MAQTPRPRSSSTAKDRFVADFAKQYDLDDVSTWPAGLSPLQLAALNKAREFLGEDVEEVMGAAQILDEAETGMPTGRLLVASGKVHTLYKMGGGYIRYLVPDSSPGSCEAVGCCNPDKKVAGGR